MTTLTPPVRMTEKNDSEASLKQVYDRTRMSLIERLSDWEDQRTWDEFYQTYWRLIYSVSLKAGLGPDEAMDVVQETILTIAKQWRGGGKYDPGKGSFKTWLLNITRWRIADQYRKKQRNPAAMNQSGGSRGADGELRSTATIERLEDDEGDVLERLWDIEWKSEISRSRSCWTSTRPSRHPRVSTYARAPTATSSSGASRTASERSTGRGYARPRDAAAPSASSRRAPPRHES